MMLMCLVQGCRGHIPALSQPLRQPCPLRGHPPQVRGQHFQLNYNYRECQWVNTSDVDPNTLNLDPNSGF